MLVIVVAWHVLTFKNLLIMAGGGWVRHLRGIEEISHFRYEDPKILSLTTYNDHGIAEGSILFSSGQRRYTRVTAFAEQGSGDTESEPYERKAIMDQILDQLQKLPPSADQEPITERKLVVHCFEKNMISAFGYDLANLPQEVRDLLWLTKIYEAAWTLRIPADGTWQVSKHSFGTITTIAPLNQLLTTAGNEPVRGWDGDSHRLLREIAAFPESSMIAIAPDDVFIATPNEARLSLVDPHKRDSTVDTRKQNSGFIGTAKWLPDLNLFFVNSGATPGFRDPKTLEPAAPPKGFPEFTTDLEPLGEDRYLVLSQEGRLSMLKAGKPYFEFNEKNIRRFRSGTSPDLHQMAVAVEFGPKLSSPSVRILQMETATGEIVRDLSPFEVPAKHYYMPGALFWSAKGDYILADLTDSQIAIWNAQTGRHRVTLGMMRDESTVNNSVMSPDKSTLYQYVHDGQINYWDMDAALSKAREFEAELDGTAVKEVKPPPQ